MALEREVATAREEEVAATAASVAVAAAEPVADGAAAEAAAAPAAEAAKVAAASAPAAAGEATRASSRQAVAAHRCSPNAVLRQRVAHGHRVLLHHARIPFGLRVWLCLALSGRHWRALAARTTAALVVATHGAGELQLASQRARCAAHKQQRRTADQQTLQSHNERESRVAAR